MSASEKIQAMLQLAEGALKTMELEVRRQHPGISGREAFLRTAARHLDRDKMIRVYGRDPASAGD